MVRFKCRSFLLGESYTKNWHVCRNAMAEYGLFSLCDVECQFAGLKALNIYPYLPSPGRIWYKVILTREPCTNWDSCMAGAKIAWFLRGQVINLTLQSGYCLERRNLSLPCQDQVLIRPEDLEQLGLCHWFTRPKGEVQCQSLLVSDSSHPVWMLEGP